MKECRVKILVKVQLLLFITLFLALTTGMIFAFRMAVSVASEEFERESQALCLSLKLSSEEALRGYRDFLLQNYINQTRNQPDVVYAYILNPEGTVLADSKPAEIGERLKPPAVAADSKAVYRRNTYVVALPLQARDGTGTAVVELSTASLRQRVKKLALEIAGMGLLIGIAGLGIAGLAARNLLSPIKHLQQGMKVVSGGDMSQRVKALGSDELAELSRSFNEMVARLEQANLDLKKAQLELVQSAKMAAVGQLGASVAHEINNPVTSLHGFAQYLSDKIPSDPSLLNYREELEMMLKESSRCKSIVENLLQYSRQGDLKSELVDLNQVIRDSLSLSSYNLYQSRIKLETGLSPDIWKAQGVAAQLQQVFINMIINAQKAMKNGGLLKVTSANLPGPAPRVEVVFSDTGQGISEEMLPKIFDPYFTTRAEEGGTGLGLSISREIILRHGGEIRVQSKINQGTMFHIILPANDRAK